MDCQNRSVAQIRAKSYLFFRRDPFLSKGNEAQLRFYGLIVCAFDCLSFSNRQYPLLTALSDFRAEMRFIFCTIRVFVGIVGLPNNGVLRISQRWEKIFN